MTKSQDLPPGYQIRTADAGQAPALRLFGERLLEETEFFLRGPEERATDDAEMASVINAFARNASAAMLNCWHGPETTAHPGSNPDSNPGPGPASTPVAEAVMIPGRLARTRHSATVGVGVLRAHWGLGIAHAMMREIEQRARAAGLRRLELTVFAPNERARRLYEGLGYAHEGVKRGSVVLPSHGAVDEIMMAKLLAE